MFKGSMVALITPFTAEGRFDEEAYRKLIEWQIEGGTDVIVSCGSTGEAATLSYQEHQRVLEVCVEQVRKRVPILAGTGSNSTVEAVDISLGAKSAGVDGLLLASPYYNKPSQEGLYQHHKKVAEKVALPQVLYNVPGRTAVNMTAATTVRLSKIDNIVGIKEASGDLVQVSEIIAHADNEFVVIAGDDLLALPIMACGGKGVISVSANIVPAEIKALVTAVAEGRWQEARTLHLRLLSLNSSMFIETNPVPVKTAAALMGMCEEVVRLPLTPLQDANKAKLVAEMTRHGLL
ncbi:MAG: 4-hydroxy-tetrahydrodipicolinate synthase [Desulfobacteraceae bacterium]|nr:MAG: 4-hydroxy-tetrahydrodipicolinate synthase [Desulfobacteraceae bacterium]